MTDDPFQRAAERDHAIGRERRRQRRRGALKIHVAVYVAVQILLFATWLVTTPGDFPWFVFPLLGWGIGVVAHAAATYAANDQGRPTFS